jgi:hypothetical protein
MDGNFKAEHQKMKNPSDDVILSDGGSFFPPDKKYKEHLKSAVDSKEVNLN